MSKLDITVIIPVHKLENQTEIDLLNAAKNSVYENKDFKPSKIVIIATPEAAKQINVKSEINSEIELVIVENKDEKTDFASQVNKAVKEEVKTKYFSILEFDDEFHNIYFRNVKQYIDAYPESSLFLPLIAEVNNEKQFLKYSNEGVFNTESATNLQFPLGELTYSLLNHLPSFIISGGVFKTDDFLEIGGIKSSIKLTYVYEYLLRITNQDQKIHVIPKVGYIHRNGRENSITTKYIQEEMAQEEIKFWFDLAKKELYFKKDRNIVYTPKKVDTEVSI